MPEKEKNMLKIKNGLVFTDGSLEKKDIYIKEGKITFSETPDCEEIDAGGKTVIPGYIDIHIHGAVGRDFNEGTEEAFDAISGFVASHGTTSVLATTSTVSGEDIGNAIEAASRKMNKVPFGAEILGVHMEGPFFNEKALGAQNPQFVQKPSMENLEKIVGDNMDVLKMIAIAPETDGASELIAEVKKKGIVPAIGHTAADYDTAKAAMDAGAVMMTHFYNAMTPLKHRDPGVVGAAFDRGNVFIQLICDFIHVHPAAIRIAINNLGRENVIMISDAISGTGLGDGKYVLGGLDIFVKDGVARIKEGNLAGSTLTLDTAMRNMLSIGYTLADTVRFLSENPARAIGVDDRKGYIREGFDADLILLDEKKEIEMVFVKGKPVYARQ